MRVLVCGGRNFCNYAFIWGRLDKLHTETPITAMIQGGARGADMIANSWARTKPGIQRFTSYADWEKHGRAAGPLRNAHMLTWKPDVVVAFPGGSGTADMVRQARAAGVKVIELS